MEDSHGWMLLGALLASRRAGESAKSAVPAIRDVRLRAACTELLAGQPSRNTAEVLKVFGVNGTERLWEQVCESLSQSGRAVRQRKLADDARLKLAQGDAEGALSAARKLVQELGGA